MDGHRATVWNKIAEDHRRWDFVEMISSLNESMEKNCYPP